MEEIQLYLDEAKESMEKAIKAFGGRIAKNKSR